MKLNWGHFETMTSDDKGHEPDSFHRDWDRDSGTRVFSHPVELPRSSSRVLLPLKSSQRQGLWPDSYIVWDTPDTLPAPSSAPTKCTCVCTRTHAHTHTHTHTYTNIWCYLGHMGVAPCDTLHTPLEHRSPTKHSQRQSGICICMRCQIIDVANKTAEGECQELTNICNKVVENQIKCHQRYMEPHTPIALFISKE